jgi:glycolate oxidase
MPNRVTKNRATALNELKRRLSPSELRLDLAAREAHAGDKWFASNLPEAVAFPRTTKAVSTIVRFANRHRIPVTARGAGYGYVGGCVPVRGISLSMAGLSRIKEINKLDFVAVVQAGVITGKLQEAVERQGLYYPPDPASRADCTIGGNIATNAGGPRCLKYGVTRDYVLD